jgi:hypothetical protein
MIIRSQHLSYSLGETSRGEMKCIQINTYWNIYIHTYISMVYFHTHLKINEACRILNMFLVEPNMCQYIYYLTISGYLRSFGASPLNLVSRVTVEDQNLDWGWCFTVEPGFQGHCGGPKLDWGWGFTVEPGFQGRCGGLGWGFTVEPGFQGHCGAPQWNLVSRVHSPE